MASPYGGRSKFACCRIGDQYALLRLRSTDEILRRRAERSKFTCEARGNY